MTDLKYQLSTGLRKTRRKISAATMAVVATAFSATIALAGGAASAASNFTLFGDATAQANGVVLVSNETQPYSGVELNLPEGVTTVDDLTNLTVNMDVLAGDCHGGAPRVSIATAEGNIFVYLGDAPNFTHCANGSTGNLLADADLRVDTSQVGGTFYDTWANAVALVGDEAITSLDIVVDGGWAGAQSFLVKSVMVNATNYNLLPEVTKESCKNNGWKTMKDSNNMSFKNQGQCVSFYAKAANN